MMSRLRSGRSAAWMTGFAIALGTALLSGTKVQGAPQYDYDCTFCHRMPPLDSATGDREPESGAVKGNHQGHAGTGAASCVKCHGTELNETGHRDQLIQVQGNINNSPLGATYGRTFFNQTSVPPSPLGSCSNVNCHFERSTPTWGSTAFSAPIDCASCHGAPPSGGSTGSAGSHARHDAFLNGPSQCGTCHPNHLAASAPFAHATSAAHATVKVAPKDRSGNASGSYSGSGANFLPSQAASQSFGSCSNTYCHSIGNPSVPAGTLPAAYSGSGYATVAWGSTSLSCNSCHGRSTTGNGAPDYPGGTAGSSTANSHAKHVDGAADTTACATCHVKTASLTVAGQFKQYSALVYHANGAPDVTFDAAQAGASAYYSAQGNTCNNVSCHGGAGSIATWGGTIACQDCHGNGASASVADFSGTFWNNGSPAKFQMTGTGSWADTGHGRPAASGNYPGSGNAAANFAGIANFCEYCHDASIGHKAAANPFRLRNLADATWGKNGVCMLCHATGSAGVTVAGQLRNGAGKVGSYHYGAKHSTALSGGQFCWDCHEPHGAGTSNQAMMRTYPALASDAATGAPTSQSATAVAFTLSATPTGTDYAKSANPYNGICNVCHTTTSHYTTTAGDGHNATSRCTTCHAHDGSSGNKATAFGASGDCVTCHSGQQGTGTRQVVGGDTALASHHMNAATIDPATCAVCHEQTTFGHMVTGDVAVGMYNQDTGATLPWDGTSATAANLETSCNSCHDSNGASRLGANALKPFTDSGDNTAPASINWSNGAQAHSANLACFNCHGNSTGVAGNTLNPKYNAHGSAAAKMLQFAYNAADVMTTTTNFCYNCHGTTIAGGVTSPSIQAAVNLSASIGHKSTKCSDCHDHHSAKAGNHASPDVIAPVLNGVAGAGGWPATNPTMATTWNGTGTLAVSYTAKPAATKEYELCFKCHANRVPAPTGYTTGALRMTDLALEFNPANKSGHPVVANLNGYTGSATPKALLASDMTTGWTTVGTQTMTCSDCHNRPGTGAMGPHGSSVRWMLTGTNQAWPFTTTAGNGTGTGTPWMLGNVATGTAPNKLFCLNCHVVNLTNGMHDALLSGGKHSGWASTARGACLSCHIRIPHGAKTSRLLRLGTAAVTGRYAPNGNGAEVGTSTQQVMSKYTKGTQTSNRRGSFTGVGCTKHTGGSDTW